MIAIGVVVDQSPRATPSCLWVVSVSHSTSLIHPVMFIETFLQLGTMEFPWVRPVNLFATMTFMNLLALMTFVYSLLTPFLC